MGGPGAAWSFSTELLPSLKEALQRLHEHHPNPSSQGRAPDTRSVFLNAASPVPTTVLARVAAEQKWEWVVESQEFLSL